MLYIVIVLPINTRLATILYQAYTAEWLSTENAGAFNCCKDCIEYHRVAWNGCDMFIHNVCKSSSCSNKACISAVSRV